MVRPHTDAFRECTLTEDAYVKVVRDWLQGAEARDSGPESLGLGRLVHYPWLSVALAEAASSHPDWSRKRGKTRGRDINAFAASILSSEPILERLGKPFQRTAYRLDRVVVEKVLVGPAFEVWPEGKGAEGLVPFDAQAWLVLRRQP